MKKLLCVLLLWAWPTYAATVQYPPPAFQLTIPDGWTSSSPDLFTSPNQFQCMLSTFQKSMQSTYQFYQTEALPLFVNQYQEVARNSETFNQIAVTHIQGTGIRNTTEEIIHWFLVPLKGSTGVIVFIYPKDTSSQNMPIAKQIINTLTLLP